MSGANHPTPDEQMHSWTIAVSETLGFQGVPPDDVLRRIEHFRARNFTVEAAVEQIRRYLDVR